MIIQIFDMYLYILEIYKHRAHSVNLNRGELMEESYYMMFFFFLLKWNFSLTNPKFIQHAQSKPPKMLDSISHSSVFQGAKPGGCFPNQEATLFREFSFGE